MKRILLPACVALLAGCASGADVSDDATATPDSAVVETLEGMAPGENVEGTQPQTP